MAESRPAILCLLLLAGLLGGCALPPLTPAPDLPPRQTLGEVPFFAQQRYQCGPAALAGVLAWSGVAVTPAELTPRLYTPALRGTLQAELLAAARRYGRVAYRLPTHTEALLQNLAEGTPVLVLQNLGLGWLPRWHYAVVVGYDLEADVITLHSGLEANHRTALDTFRRTWARADHWAMVALPPDLLPASATRADWLAGAAALERVGRAGAARQAYVQALRRWPDEPLARLGLGNSAFALDDLAGAEAAFRRLLQQRPGMAAAHNNLALVLQARGRLAEARAEAERAVDLGGPHAAAYADTLALILRQQAGPTRPPQP